MNDIEKAFGKEYTNGFKDGLKLAQQVADDSGFELHFPDIDTLKIDKQ